ncbi:MAG: AAA family ATPase [Candidatus Sumerlaeota bacterium]|nr:AAA family ATPase [Candidatus Sumerlaeota bacterium]
MTTTIDAAPVIDATAIDPISGIDTSAYDNATPEQIVEWNRVFAPLAPLAQEIEGNGAGDNGTGPSLFPATMSARALAMAVIAAMVWIVEGIRPVGLTVIGSRPKRGKSWLELLIAVCVAMGQALFGVFAVTSGAVLYLALEDSAGRMKRRLEILGLGHPTNLEFAFTWPRLDKGGLQALRAWLECHPDAREIVIDTWPRIKPPRPRGADPYESDYGAMAILQGLALEFGVAIVLVLHQRKAPDDDIFATITGTLGNVAAADVIAVLLRKGSRGTLALTGRDLGERTLARGTRASLALPCSTPRRN